MKSFVLLLTAIFIITVAKAQTAEDSVKAVVNKLFEAMRNADATQLNSVFADSAILQTIGASKTKGTMVRTDLISKFAESIGSLPKNAADERINFETIKIDGPLALVWTPYQFFYNGVFSHCGVNSFHLVRFNGEWKIQYLIDTRRKAGCVVK